MSLSHSPLSIRVKPRGRPSPRHLGRPATELPTDTTAASPCAHQRGSQDTSQPTGTTPLGSLQAKHTRNRRNPGHAGTLHKLAGPLCPPAIPTPPPRRPPGPSQGWHSRARHSAGPPCGVHLESDEAGARTAAGGPRARPPGPSRPRGSPPSPGGTRRRAVRSGLGPARPFPSARPRPSPARHRASRAPARPVRDPPAKPSGAAGGSRPGCTDERRDDSRSSHLGTSGSGRRAADVSDCDVSARHARPPRPSAPPIAAAPERLRSALSLAGHPFVRLVGPAHLLRPIFRRSSLRPAPLASPLGPTPLRPALRPPARPGARRASRRGRAGSAGSFSQSFLVLGWEESRGSSVRPRRRTSLERPRPAGAPADNGYSAAPWRRRDPSILPLDFLQGWRPAGGGRACAGAAAGCACAPRGGSRVAWLRPPAARGSSWAREVRFGRRAALGSPILASSCRRPPAPPSRTPRCSLRPVPSLRARGGPPAPSARGRGPQAACTGAGTGFGVPRPLSGCPVLRAPAPGTGRRAWPAAPARGRRRPGPPVEDRGDEAVLPCVSSFPREEREVQSVGKQAPGRVRSPA